MAGACCCSAENADTLKAERCARLVAETCAAGENKRDNPAAEATVTRVINARRTRLQ